MHSTMFPRHCTYPLNYLTKTLLLPNACSISILENVLGLHRVIQLEEVQIMARDENTRVLHFRNRNKSIRVKHLGIHEILNFFFLNRLLSIR